jgi:hypothetical protein
LVARHRYPPYASIASGKVSGLFTVKVRIKFRDGSTMRLKERWGSGRLDQSDGETLMRYLKAIR